MGTIAKKLLKIPAQAVGGVAGGVVGAAVCGGEMARNIVLKCFEFSRIEDVKIPLPHVDTQPELPDETQFIKVPQKRVFWAGLPTTLAFGASAMVLTSTLGLGAVTFGPLAGITAAVPLAGPAAIFLKGAVLRVFWTAIGPSIAVGCFGFYEGAVRGAADGANFIK